ncbi:MAG: hypothetical protein ALECFALPRED_008979, partial [Alectoria fallacina]
PPPSATHSLNDRSLYSPTNTHQQQQHLRHHQQQIARPAAMDAAQKRSDFETSIKKPAMTEDEVKKQKERKAHELQIMLERADRAVEGNRRLLAKKKVQGERREAEDEKWALYFRGRKDGRA